MESCLALFGGAGKSWGFAFMEIWSFSLMRLQTVFQQPVPKERWAGRRKRGR